MARVQIPISFQFVDGGSGALVPATAATITITDRNTSAPATVWSGFTGSGVISSVVTDSVGNVPGYLDEGSYVIVAGSAGGFGGAAVNWEAVRGDGVANIGTGAVTPTALAAAVQQALFSPGDLKHSAVPTAPTGWLLCDGSAVSRSGANANLFGEIGTTYGSGDGSTTFNLPDYRGRVAIGAGTGTATGATAWTRGQHPTSGAGGEETHLLLAAESGIQNHGHTVPGTTSTTATENQAFNFNFSGETGTESAAHVHSVAFDLGIGTAAVGSGMNVFTLGANFQIGPFNTAGENVAHAHAFSGTTGTQNQNHNHNFTIPTLTATAVSANATSRTSLMPPVTVGNWFIKL